MGNRLSAFIILHLASTRQDGASLRASRDRSTAHALPAGQADCRAGLRHSSAPPRNAAAAAENRLTSSEVLIKNPDSSPGSHRESAQTWPAERTPRQLQSTKSSAETAPCSTMRRRHLPIGDHLPEPGVVRVGGVFSHGKKLLGRRRPELARHPGACLAHHRFGAQFIKLENDFGVRRRRQHPFH